MNKNASLQIGLELIWWIVTLLVVGLVIYPILSKLVDYPFTTINIIFIIVFITFARYIFLLKHTFLASRQWLKAVLMVLSIPLIFYLVNGINYFQTFLDEEGMEAIMQGVELSKQRGLSNYIRSEVLLFGTGSVIVGIIFPIRLMLSIWRTHNRGTV